MRKTLIAVLFAATLPALALAMPDGGPRHGGDHGPRFFKSLNLTDQQRQDIRQLMGEQMKNRHDINEKYLDKLPAAEKKAMQDELKAQHDKTQSAIRAKLTPEQQKQFDELQKKMEERRAERAEFQAWKAQKDKAQ
ncbi:Spy/CpxP family protein refolding chaperone [Pseudomonas sp. UL073]|uniref:Spy/CpxP family protein refolding chaperone n=1 Tax=Zestomonas insulae TaxID=2809017 RepID=A0ABS2ICS0_9GAMM|nr:Spy/CpxP family protein refolding chaperone [Pseudomonas insulae]MBM7060820.1 Spy/CpxP family protein refolding chaperone [Pseudomonas insulae]